MLTVSNFATAFINEQLQFYVCLNELHGTKFCDYDAKLCLALFECFSNKTKDVIVLNK